MVTSESLSEDSLNGTLVALIGFEDDIVCKGRMTELGSWLTVDERKVQN